MNTAEIKPTKTKKKKRNHNDPAKIILIIGLIIILVPCIVLGVILIQASRASNTPVVGERFTGDLNPAISNSDAKDLEKAIGAMSGVEKCEVILMNGQMRVLIDVPDSSTKNEIIALAEKAFDTVTGKLSVNTYFTNTNNKRMYDLEITVFNHTNADDDQIYHVLMKKGTSEEVVSQTLTDPADEEYVNSLNKE